MSPRVLDVRNCPHCGFELPAPPPRICPDCAGSLQKRHLASGCISSKPPLILLALGAALYAAHAIRAARLRAAEPAAVVSQAIPPAPEALADPLR